MKLEICKQVQKSSCVVPEGGNNFCALRESCATARAQVTQLDMRQLSGIVTYEPTEFLVTAQAGTPIRELQAALTANGQYLPFDPVRSNGGATLGGTVASGVSGANRMLYGGLRDFVMEVELIDGLGNLVRGGGKVVKNAAGFDLPKMVVGSYGRLGVLTEITLKVFPQPQAYITWQVQGSNLADTVRKMQLMQANPLPISALEIEKPNLLLIRFAAQPDAFDGILRRARLLLGTEGSLLSGSQESDYWRGLSELSFANHLFDGSSQGQQSALIRVGLSGHKLRDIDQALAQLDSIEYVRYSNGGSVAWIVANAATGFEAIDIILSRLGLSGVVLRRGVQIPESTSNFLGNKDWIELATRIQRAMDPQQKFLRYA